MQSTPHPNDTDPHDVIEITPDVVLVPRADRAEKKDSPSLTPGAVERRSDPQFQMQSDATGSASAPRVDTTFRATVVDKVRPPANQSEPGKWLLRMFVAFLFALCSAVAAAAWQAYGDSAEHMLAKWTQQWVPHFTLSSLLRSSPPSTDHAAPSPPQPAALATAAPVQPAPAQATPAQTPIPQAAAPAQLSTAGPPANVARSAESTQLLKSMAHDLSTTRQDIEELKGSLKELNEREEQMSRELAKLSEQRLRPKISAKRPAPALRPAERRPRTPTYYYHPRAALAPVLPRTVAPPVSLQSAPPPVSSDPVPTPPMPVR
jgi:hypothetical protein